MKEERVYKVYIHTNKINSKKYVGITMRKPEKRFGFKGNGYKPCPYFYKAIQKYGWENFEHEIVLCNLTKQEAEMFEIELIKYYKSNDSTYGYNIANGGNSVGKIAQSTKDKISQAHTGKKLSEKHKENIGKGNPDKKQVICIETGDIFNSITIASEKFNIHTTSIVAVCKNKRHTVNDLHFAYLKDYLENKSKYIHLKYYINKSVICLNTMIVYNSAKDAASSLGINKISVRMCCNGIYKSAGGYNWMYLEEYKKYGFCGKLEINKNFKKKVLRIEGGIIFNNLTEAASSIGLTNSAVGNCCNGRNKTAGGYHWKYVD